MADDNKIKLTYFPVRGRGEAIRLLLKATGVSHSDEATQDWMALKPKMVFGQVPFMEHKDFNLNQSMAILRYVARETGTYGSNNKEAGLIDMIMDGEEEWRAHYVSIIYSRPPFSNYTEDIKEYINSYLPTQFPIFEKLLVSNHGGSTWFVGEKMSCIDCLMFEILDIHEILAPGCLNGYPHLKAFRERFAAIPAIADHIQHHRQKRVNGNGKGQ